tara:strand:+ start:2551 stop:2910 length:360 start_codon:yes stop_codon:yes gene_type:complete
MYLAIIDTMNKSYIGSNKSYLILYTYNPLHENLIEFTDLYKSIFNVYKYALLCIITEYTVIDNVMFAYLNRSFWKFLMKLKIRYKNKQFIKKGSFYKNYLKLRGREPNINSYIEYNLLN